MAEEVKSFDMDANSIQEFTVQFHGEQVSIDGTTMPVGQVTTEILNLPQETIQALQESSAGLAKFLTGRFVEPEIKKDGSPAKELQEHVNRVQDILFQIPPYSYMALDKELARNVWAELYKAEPENFRQMFVAGSLQNEAMRNYSNSMMNASPEILEFRGKLQAMLEVYFEPLQKRNASEYARAARDFIEAGRLLDDQDALFRNRSFFKLEQTRRAMVEYIPMSNPEEPGEFVIAERMVFHSIAEFLHMDLFRALIHGIAPRRCHNCGTYFLLTKSYNTFYCNNVAPGETERTCRKVGAHKKEAAKAGDSPIAVEYRRVYKRLTGRKHRGKISVEEWNGAVAKAQGYKEKAERGELSEFELKDIYDAF